MNRTYIAYQNRMKYIINIILIFGALILSDIFKSKFLELMTFNRNFQKKSNIQKTLKGTGAEYTIATENCWLAI